MKVFLSCVTREFGFYSVRLAEQLGSLRQKQFEVKIQEDFQQGASPSSTSSPPASATATLSFISPELSAALARPPTTFMPCSRTSPIPSPIQLPSLYYTQWEYELALRLGRHTLRYIARAETRRECTPPAGPGCDQPEDYACLQSSPRRAYQAAGQALRRVHQPPRAHPQCLSRPRSEAVRQGQQLPFASIGSLVKGRDAFLEKLRAFDNRSGVVMSQIMWPALDSRVGTFPGIEVGFFRNIGRGLFKHIALYDKDPPRHRVRSLSRNENSHQIDRICSRGTIFDFAFHEPLPLAWVFQHDRPDHFALSRP